MAKESSKPVGVGVLVLTVFILCAILALSGLDAFVVRLREFALNRYGWGVADWLIWIAMLFALCVLAGWMGGIDKIPQNLGRVTGFFIRLFRHTRSQPRNS